MHMLTALGAALALTACAATPPPEDQVPEYGATGKTCNAARAQHLVGRAGTAELAREALRLTGAGTMRWLKPGQVVTMEYRADRLNIDLDAQGRVKAVRCG